MSWFGGRLPLGPQGLSNPSAKTGSNVVCTSESEPLYAWSSEPVYSAITVVLPAVVNPIVHENVAKVAVVKVGLVSTQLSPLPAVKVTWPLLGALGEAPTAAVNVTGWPTVDGSGVSATILIVVAMPGRWSTTRLLAG